MRSAPLSNLLLAALLGCSGGGEGRETPVDANVVESADSTVADARTADAAREAGVVPSADSTRDSGIVPPTDAASDALPPPPADAEPDVGLVEPWAPTPGPWDTYPEHPFRHGVDEAGAYGVLVASSDGETIVAAGEEGLALFQVDAQGRADVVSRLSLASPVADLALSADGRTAILAAGGFSVVSLADVRLPVVLGTFDSVDAATGVALSADGRRAVVTTAVGLLVLDLRDPAVPTRLGSLGHPNLGSIAVATDGQTAFASDAQGVVIIDLREPAAPAIVGSFGVQGFIDDLAVDGDGALVFVARWQGVSIFDVRDRSAPVLVGRSDSRSAGYTDSIAFSADERTMFVADGSRVRIVDVREPFAPTQRGAFEVSGFILEVGVLGDDRLLLTTSAGMQVLDLRNPWDQPLVGRLEADQCWQPADVKVSPDGETAFVVGRDALMALDIADPRAPRLLATLAEPGTNLSVSNDGQTLYAAGERALLLFDVRDPATLAPVGTFDEPSASPMDIVVSSNGALAYLATEGGGGLDILDLEAPGAPELLNSLYIRHTESLVLAADEQTVFVADPYENGLMVIDVRDPRAPSTRARLPHQVFALELSPDGTTLVATSPEGVLVVDVSDPDVPMLLATYVGVQRPGDVVFSPNGETLIIADGPGGVNVVDFTERLAPRLLGAFDTPGDPTDLALTPDGNTAVVTSESVSPCVTLVEVGQPPALEPAEPPAAGVQRYVLRWTDRYPDHPEQIAWHATGGNVVVSAVDQMEHTALVDWTPPAEGPEAPALVIAVGNHHSFQLAYAP